MLKTEFEAGCQVLVTGANGFIGKNLVVRLRELSGVEVSLFLRGDSIDRLLELVKNADVIFHLAGENRPKDESNFFKTNVGLTEALCDAIKSSGRHIRLILASSTQANCDNLYGRSKLAAESLVSDLALEKGCAVHIFRLPGIFGKWCRPNYNSVVATFCYNISHGLPITIDDADTVLQLAYIDDVVEEFLQTLNDVRIGLLVGEIKKTYSTSPAELAETIAFFKEGRSNLMTGRVGSGLTRALYSTYLSYLPPAQFVYDLPSYEDERGIFVEMLKTPDCGQLSFFTVQPGVTRGSHYHHTKTEKFLIVKGKALMRFRNLVTGDVNMITVSADRPQVVDSIPGWVHDITNVESEEAIIMLWANEIFDRRHPDCIPCKVLA